MSYVQVKKDARIFVDDDFSSNEVNEDLVGKKGFSLFRTRDMDVPVPAFMVISSAIFSEYIADTLGSDLSTSSSIKDINRKILSGAFSEQLTSEIQQGYSRLSGFTDSWVAVRSSIVAPIGQRGLTFAGQLSTVLNVRGLSDLLEAIKSVYASAFTEKVASYLATRNSSIAEIKVAVVIQKMIQSEASGVVYTVDPISQDSRFLTIEAVFGLGDVIASGEITPDQYILEKETLKFKEKKIVPQEWMVVRKAQSEKGKDTTQKVHISKNWQYQQKLDNKYLEELAKISMLIEKKAQKPQDIEWVFEGGRIWILQIRDIEPINIAQAETKTTTKLEKDIISSAKEIARVEEAKQKFRKELEQKKAEKKSSETSEIPESAPTPKTTQPEEVLVAKPIQRQIIKNTPSKSAQEETPKEGERLIVTGIGAGEGLHRGKAIIITDPKDFEKDKKKLKKEAVLVIKDQLPGLDRYVSKVGAVVADTGGTTSDIAIMCREAGIPCVLGTHISSRMIKEDEEILVDGKVGAVYAKHEHVPSVSSAVVDEITSKDEKISEKNTTEKPTEVKKESVEKETKPQVKTATKIFTDISDSLAKGNKWQETIKFSDGVVVVQIEDIFKKENRHPGSYIEDGKTTELVKLISDSLSEICEKAEGNTVVASIGSMTVKEYQNLTRGKTLEKWDDDSGITDTSRGIDLMLKRPKELKAVLKAIKRTRNVDGYRNISLAFDYAGTPEKIVEMKKQVSAVGLRRSSTFNLYLVVETPSEAMVMDEYVKIGLDGVFVNIGNLSRQMMAPSTDDESVLKILDSIAQSWKGMHMTIMLPAKSEDLLKRAIKAGSHGISVAPARVEKTRERIVEIERELVFK